MVAGIVLFCVAMTGLAIANLFWYELIGEVNRKREDGNLVSYFGFTFFKMTAIVDEYRKILPTGRAHVYMFVAFAFLVAGLIAFAVCARIIG